MVAPAVEFAIRTGGGGGGDGLVGGEEREGESRSDAKVVVGANVDVGHVCRLSFRVVCCAQNKLAAGRKEGQKERREGDAREVCS